MVLHICGVIDVSVTELLVTWAYDEFVVGRGFTSDDRVRDGDELVISKGSFSVTILRLFRDYDWVIA